MDYSSISSIAKLLLITLIVYLIFKPKRHRNHTTPESKQPKKHETEVSNIPMVGIVESVCPYCDFNLPKKPGRKTKCKNCGDFIYVRTSPKTSERILIREDQIETIEEHWSIVNGSHEEFLEKKNEYEEDRRKLKKKFGKEPSENDIQWSLQNKQLLKHASQYMWGLYRNNYLKMTEILIKEKKTSQALSFYLNILYLDINGASNTAKDMVDIAPPFDLSMKMIAPGIIAATANLINELELTESAVKTEFIKTTSLLYKNIKIIPMKPKESWLEIKDELFN